MWLLDGNVLVALAIDTHEFHERVRRWFDFLSEPFATWAITEGTRLRLHLKLAAVGRATAAWTVLEAIHQMPDHLFLDDGFSYREIKPTGLAGSPTPGWLSLLVVTAPNSRPLTRPRGAA
jgi:predicted nucleic acid-binding protein